MTDEFPLYEQSRCWDVGIDIPNKRGFLAIFLKEGEEHEQAVPEDWREGLIRNDRLLYIGAAKLQNRIRSHFSGEESTRDTLRRSIGAMLRQTLNLKPTGLTDGDLYRFCDEEPLSNWIQTHCTFSYCEHNLNKKETDDKKREIIQNFKPPLNIEYNNRFCHPKLLEARDICVELAEKSKLASTNESPATLSPQRGDEAFDNPSMRPKKSNLCVGWNVKCIYILMQKLLAGIWQRRNR